MEKVLNFRDLGGIPVAGGKKVKSGLFYRSGMLNDATENDIEFLKSLGLKVIFDYRDMLEAEFLKSSPYEKLGIKRAHYPSDLNNEKLFKLKKSTNIKRFFHKCTLEDIKITYRHLPFNNAGYKAMVKAMEEGEVPFLQHCSAGKDRAGLGSALILAVLGASYEDILKDYMLSMQYKDGFADRLASFLPKFMRNFIKKRYEALFIVDKELLDTAIQVIKEKYGSFDTYLLAEYNLDQAKIERLREMYTAP
ncbi:MAG: tyrosine-protein phosphatase [Christensenellales bacterium]|jgi:protein-tyrosine phosphatase